MTTRVDTDEEEERTVEQLTTGYLKPGEERLLEVVGLSMLMTSSESPPTIYLQDRGTLGTAPKLLGATVYNFENWDKVAVRIYRAQVPLGLIGMKLLVRREPEGLVIHQVRYGRTP
ncbi:MAG: hypothetical protein KGJ23_08610 [Euryarchaeota archaeon]|nr:hypothetical protein [Euryarchaeota archaeon]MDE1836664.1 hypothetical protein [Euryarchaeota archaeon]MDE1880307.1 hypothetical protein [Euryarchaeota archaeon]MDE2044634.1 hypothetical protein [Thermoplasmata archaeon]